MRLFISILLRLYRAFLPSSDLLYLQARLAKSPGPRSTSEASKTRESMGLSGKLVLPDDGGSGGYGPGEDVTFHIRAPADTRIRLAFEVRSQHVCDQCNPRLNEKL